VFVAFLGVNAELSINQTRYSVKFTIIIPKDYQTSFLARFISPIEVPQGEWKPNCDYFYLDAQHKVSNIFLLCFAEKNAHISLY